MFIICGKSASGKDTLSQELISRGYKRVVTYTTRPPRDGEVDGETYHFITNAQFQEMLKNHEFAEYNVFHTEFGDWYYGSAIKDYVDEPDRFIILTPSGIREVKEELEFMPHVIYLFANLSAIQRRLKLRGDNPDEAKRRIEADISDFKGFEQETDRIIYNNDDNIVAVADKLEQFLKVKENRI